MQGIYTYIPETNHVPSEYRVSSILSLLFMVSISLVPALALLFFYVSTFRSMCAVPNMDVFCSSLTSWFPGMLLMYFLNDFEMVPFATIITSITLVYYYYYYYYYYYLLDVINSEEWGSFSCQQSLSIDQSIPRNVSENFSLLCHNHRSMTFV